VNTIVFCEDAPAIRKLISIAMRGAPHRVLIAEDGRSGLEMIRAERPQLVVTDLAMPDLDGTQLFDELRQDPELARIPVVFLSASSQRNLLEAARNRPARAYLSKPFSPAALRQLVDELLD
jgi:two-component system chemotaxis response regulator CheY